MQLQLPQLSADWRMSAATYVAGFVATVTFILFLRRSNGPSLNNIPTVGSSTWLGSWWSGIQFLVDATDVMQEGYDKYKGSPFKVSGLFRWMVVISGRQHVEEFCKRRDDELNFVEALEDILKAEHTFGRDTHRNPYHITALRNKLNRNLVSMYDDIRDEIVTAFEDVLKLEGHDWKSVPALHTSEEVVCRTSNRVLVGLPLCRDPDWIRLNIDFPLEVFKGAAIITLFPTFMEPLVAWAIEYFTKVLKRSVNHMTPLIEARRKQLADGATEQPNDCLTWLLEGSEGSQSTVTDLTRRVLAINFAAIHTTSQIFTQALYSLATNPKYIPILREEVESVVREHGWTKASLAKMHHVDSFMKEVLRMYGVTLTNVMRKTVKDVTFSDGTVVPKGTFVVLATQNIHLDEEFYDNAASFNPLRFSKMREGEGDHLKHQFSSTTTEYLPFGHGRHACPGRFFAASELTTMLAHVVHTYDIKLEDPSVRPPNIKISAAVVPNTTAQIMFRRRLP